MALASWHTHLKCDSDLCTAQLTDERRLNFYADLQQFTVDAIECRQCHNTYHLHCTDIYNKDTWKRMHKYRDMWRCEKCEIPGSKESKLVMMKLATLKLHDIMIKH